MLVSLLFGGLSVATAAPVGVPLEAMVNHLSAASSSVELLVTIDGRHTPVTARQVDVLGEGVVPLVQGAAGTRPADLGGLTTWTLDGPGIDMGFVGISNWGVAGFIESPDGVHIISAGAWGKNKGEVTAVRTDDLPPTLFELPPCETRVTHEGWAPPIPTRGGGDGQPCRVANLAIETDWEYTERIFEGNADAGAAYAVTITGAMTEIYTTELNVRFALSYLRVWSDDSDPYDPDSSVDMLDQFRNHWTSNMSGIDRTVAHILTGRTNLPYGGVAWLGVLCNTNYGYAVSGYLNGSFPQPIEDNNGNNWDLLVMAHELGHNFGTLHTHDGFSPPLDNCGNGDCTGAENGTIMSYCHICAGGVSNIELGFRPEVREVILGYLDAIEDGCSLDAGSATAVDDEVWTLVDVPVDINVLANDAAATCEVSEVAIDAYDAQSAMGGVITLVPGEAGEFDQLNYVPPVGFDGQDSFSYEIPSGAAATVTIDVIDLREPDSHGELADGLKIDYYALTAPQQLPDFDSLDPYLDGLLAQVNLPSTDGAFAGSGRADEVGAVCTAMLDVPADGLYTFYTESDDGSKLYVGDLEVVDNDGIHGMVEAAGVIGLEQGRHRIAVEFFENTAGAGLIVRWSGPGLAKQIIPAAYWAYEIGDDAACPEDVDASGTVDVNDLLAVISAFGPCAECDEDFNGDGEVDVNEILAVLALFGQDC